MRLPRLTRLTGRVLIAAVVLLAVTGVVLATLVSSVGELRDAGTRAEQNREVSAIANRLERLVIDVETGSQGFVISGDESFLRPYRAAQTRIPATYGDLVTAIADPRQREQAMRIGGGVLSYLDEWAVPLVAVTQGDRQAGMRLVATGEGKSRVDVIRARFEEFAARQANLQRTRIAEADDGAGRATLLAYVAFGVLAVLIVLGVVYATRTVARTGVRRSVARRRRGEPQTAARSRLEGS